MKKAVARPYFKLVLVMVTAISVASNPNRVVNLMTGFKDTEDVSLKGSPTVSPTTLASCSGVFFIFKSTSSKRWFLKASSYSIKFSIKSEIWSLISSVF